MLIKKVVVNGEKFRIRETENYLEYTVDGDLIIGLNKMNNTMLHEKDLVVNYIEEADLNLLDITDLRNLMVQDLEKRIELNK